MFLCLRRALCDLYVQVINVCVCDHANLKEAKIL